MERQDVTVTAGTAAASAVPPAQEQRGGNRVDWKNVVPGAPLPERPAAEYPEPDSGQLPLWEDTAPLPSPERDAAWKAVVAFGEEHPTSASDLDGGS